jgi:hypothetical protein
VRTTMFLRACAAAAVLLAGAACDGGTEPEAPLASTYVLSTVDGDDSLVIADHTTGSGIRQLYTMVYDSLTFDSPTTMYRRLRATVESFDPQGTVLPLVTNGYLYSGQVLRRRNQVVVQYQGTTPVKPDTFTLFNGNLVKMGPYGVSCAGCTPVRQVEYVYTPG